LRKSLYNLLLNRTSKFSKGQQDSKDNFTTRRDLAEFKEYLLRDQKSLALLVLWNLSFYGILALSEIFYHPYIARFGTIFLVTSYWVAAHHLNALSLNPEMINNEVRFRYKENRKVMFLNRK